MDIFRKNYIPDLISVKSIISVWHQFIKGGGNPVPDIHDFWEFVYVEEGTFNLFVDGKLITLAAGEGVLHPPLALHVGTGEAQSCILKIISFESDSGELHTIERRALKLTSQARELFNQAADIGLKSFYMPENSGAMRGMRLNDDADRFEIQKMKKNLELALINITANSGLLPYAKSNAENYKKEECSDFDRMLKINIGKNLSLTQMADALSISTSHLKKLSYEAYGMPPVSYFITMKLDAAKRMIRESALNFTEISESLGFSSIHYFSRLFKKRVGMTPSEYAKSESNQHNK